MPTVTCSVGYNYKIAVLSQRRPRDAPIKVNKQAKLPHLHLRSRDSVDAIYVKDMQMTSMLHLMVISPSV